MSNWVCPFRDYDDHDVVNLFSIDTSTGNAGMFVKVTPGEGFEGTDRLLTNGIGASYANTVSNRWIVPARVTLASSGDEAVLGMMLAETRETDENSEQLIFNPRKAVEMGVVRSGEVTPIATRGMFLLESGAVIGFPRGGEPLYVNGGRASLTGFYQMGQFIGAHDAHGRVAVRINCA